MSATERVFKNDRDRWAFEESTRDPIFLLQSRRLVLRTLPSGFKLTEEDYEIIRDDDRSEEPKLWSLDEIREQYGDDYVSEEWDVVGVWFSRAEASDFARRTQYRYEKWRVYCVCADGELRDILKQEAERREPQRLTEGE